VKAGWQAWPSCHLVDGVVAGVALVRPPKQPQGTPGRCLVLQGEAFEDDQRFRTAGDSGVWQLDHMIGRLASGDLRGGARSSHPPLGWATCSGSVTLPAVREIPIGLIDYRQSRLRLTCDQVGFP
jgi:hypothetical protein